MSAADRIGVTISSLEASNNSLIADVRSSLVTIKMIAEDLERENRSDMIAYFGYPGVFDPLNRALASTAPISTNFWVFCAGFGLPDSGEALSEKVYFVTELSSFVENLGRVKQLDEAALELIPVSDDIVRLSSALQSIGREYNSSNELTDFKKLIDEHISKLEADSPSVPENHLFYKQFKEAVWRVHHADEPMPGEEQEEIIMTSSQCNLVNTTCPLTGKPVTELEDPVRSTECKHIYEKKAVMDHIRVLAKKRGCKCAAAGCPKMLTADKLICDPLLRIEIDELRLRGNRSTQAQIVADCTEIDED